MSARSDILSRIREAVGQADPALPVQRNYRQSAPVNLDNFIEKLRDYNAEVYRCEEKELDATIARAKQARNKTNLLIAPRDNHRTYAELDQAEGVLTTCTVAISITGTIILTHSETEGPRALTLIPDYHLCIVREDQVVETVPEAIRRLPRGRPVTTISGPSATADIEMMRVKGVHGPRTLDVIIVT